MEEFVQVIGIDEAFCVNCHQCIAICPVKICSDGSGDVVKFDNHSCIGCGRCIEACIRSHGGDAAKSARFPIDDSAQFMSDIAKNDIIALVAPSAQCNFNLKSLISGLRALGVKAVYDVSLGAEITIAAYHHAISSGQLKSPVIAQPCPAVVTYIELHHPDLIEYLAPIGSPVHNLATYVRSIHPDTHLAFISPCLAKRREFQKSKMVEYNITFQSLNRIFKEQNIDLNILADSEFDNKISAGIAVNFSTPGGLKESYLYRHPGISASAITRVEGPVLYKRYLANLSRAIKNGEPDLPMIVDLLSCERGCNMGAGCINYRKTIDEIESAVARRSEESIKEQENDLRLQKFLSEVLQEHDFQYSLYKDLSWKNNILIPDSQQLEKIFAEMYKVEEKDFRNCAACGYNSCYYMAVAVFNGLNKVENCHLYQEKELRKEHEILNQMVEESVELNKQLETEIAERKQQEQLLVQNSKLAAMGEMIGMIAHQWRQPLSSISTLSGNIKVLIDLDMMDKDQFVVQLQEINNHAQYLSRTINDFRHFFKPDNPKESVMMDDIIENTLGIIGKSMEYKNIDLVKDCDFKHKIFTYPRELMQVFLNILKNATDAFVERGVADPRVLIRGYEKDGYQCIEVQDNAGGIPEEIINKIYDPYFSTKGPAKGTGLGLYMSKTIIEEHCRGRILASNRDQGACIAIQLPILQQGA
ncbi:MAG TPA: [Fe-Fe] hydrogenase large subunit C-terminal domain-containing protein [Syntrophomonadaceae bacterium]|nr:[Fe-Fe] hydrogenase large subunit C-terminal domain-containing protein [Syntrophomonadaceae bacterium]